MSSWCEQRAGSLDGSHWDYKDFNKEPGRV
jgi:hypothetical protein